MGSSVGLLHLLCSSLERNVTLSAEGGCNVLNKSYRCLPFSLSFHRLLEGTWGILVL